MILSILIKLTAILYLAKGVGTETGFITTEAFLKRILTKNPVIVGSTSCQYCIKAKALLDRLNISYDNVDTGMNPHIVDYMRNTYGHRTVPAIFMCGKFIGGFSELKVLTERCGLGGATEGCVSVDNYSYVNGGGCAPAQVGVNGGGYVMQSGSSAAGSCSEGCAVQSSLNGANYATGLFGAGGEGCVMPSPYAYPSVQPEACATVQQNPMVGNINTAFINGEVGGKGCYGGQSNWQTSGCVVVK